MFRKLPRPEILLYSSVWLVSFVYSMYKVYEGGILLQLTYFEHQDFSPALISGLPSYRDSSDYDWGLWTGLLAKLSPWILAHILVAETFRYFDKFAIPFCHSLITLGALVCLLPTETTFIIIIVLTLFFFALVVRSKLLIWLLAVGLLLSVNFLSKYFFYSYHSKYDEITLTLLCFEWFLLKCIDFTLEEVTTRRSLLNKVIDLLGYTFYLPCFFLGPFVPYENFKKGLYRDYQPWTTDRVKNFIFGLMRALFWYYFFELATHFFYCHAMHFKVDHIVSLGLWTLNGVGLCMAQFFFIKYTVVYGAALCIARAELYEVPPNPKCVNRIHLYSNMWRHFDRGFYLFLMRCIYIPISGHRNSSLWRKLLASFYCFCFVFLWHGINRTMLIWSTMNFIGICFESVGKFVAETKLFTKLRKLLSKENSHRLEALICSPLWIMAVVSNYIFFGDYELGMAYVQQIFQADAKVLLFILTIGYCMCQICMGVRSLDRKKQILRFSH